MVWHELLPRLIALGHNVRAADHGEAHCAAKPDEAHAPVPSRRLKTGNPGDGRSPPAIECRGRRGRRPRPTAVHRDRPLATTTDCRTLTADPLTGMPGAMLRRGEHRPLSPGAGVDLIGMAANRFMRRRSGGGTSHRRANQVGSRAGAGGQDDDSPTWGTGSKFGGERYSAFTGRRNVI
jgi:hypothetical protein